MTKATVAPIPTKAQPRVLIASVVRKPREVVEAFTKTLQWQQGDAMAKIALIANYAKGEENALEALEIPHEAVEAPAGDYGEREITRGWTAPAFERVAEIKDKFIARAKADNFDYLWLVDADVMCDPFTLQTLIDSDAPIVSAVYWTNWQRAETDTTTFVHAGPQVWQRGSYDMASHWMSAEDFRHRLVDRARLHLKMGGLGACTLIRADALHKGISFQRFRDNPMGAGGMCEGEDRHFCARAHALHVKLYADAWSDIWHAYHPAEYDQIDERMKALEAWPHPDAPSFGDLVSFTVEHLEPVADAQGRMHILGKRFMRGKFGALNVLPQIEEAVGSLTRRDAKLLRVHFPAHYAVVQLRNQTRIMRVQLLDCKPFRYAPTIEDELFVATESKRYLDSIEMTPNQVQDMLGDSHERKG